MNLSFSGRSGPAPGLVTRAALCVAGGALLALDIQTFVHTGGIQPSGFVGLALLVRESMARFAGVTIPYGPLYILFNAIPAILCWRLVGRRFTILSCLSVFAGSILADVIPARDVVGDPVLVAVFGGLVHGFAISLCLLGRATSGGMDFVSILLLRRYRVDGWWVVLHFNAAVLLCAGAIVGWERVLWSIVYQFVSTQTIRALHNRYNRHAMIIVTDRAEEVAELIRRETRHDATRLEATGVRGVPHKFVYSVVNSDEVASLARGIREIDPKSFINAFKTDFVSGHWYERPED